MLEGKTSYKKTYICISYTWMSWIFIRLSYVAAETKPASQMYSVCLHFFLPVANVNIPLGIINAWINISLDILSTYKFK